MADLSKDRAQSPYTQVASVGSPLLLLEFRRAAARPALPAGTFSYRKRPRKQHIKSAREIAERILADRRQADALAAYKLQEEAKKAAEWRHQRQRTTADHQAAKKQKEEEAEAIRAVARAEAAAARRVGTGAAAKMARKQGKAPLACRATAPKAASQRQSSTSSGSKSSRQGPAEPRTPPKKAARPQPSSSGSEMSSLEADSTRFCRCCCIMSYPHRKVDKHQEAFLAQQAKGHGAAEGVPMEAEPPQGGQGAQVADEQQGSAVHNLRGDDSHTTGLPQPAAAVATAGQEAVHLQRYSLRKSGRRQQLQQAQLGGGDEGSGTEAGPKARRKRSPDDSFVQRPAKKRTGMGGGARGDAALLAEDGTEMVEGEGSGAAGAVNNGGTLAAMDSGMENAQRRRVLTRRKALS
ncbi:hypothetical protein ABBQ38_013460 [Trebouxia sp. C0009 RCD-2024]